MTACIRLLPLLVVGFLMTACASGRPPLGNPEVPYPPPRPPAVGDILHMPTGFYVSEAQMLDAATDARIVYVGETHDNPASHRQQLAVLRAMAERWPGQVALGMEMFTPAQQPALDRWVAGELTEKEFLQQSEWNRVWRLDFAYYRDLLNFAREKKIPVIGLNAEKTLVKAIGSGPVAELPPEQRTALPEIDMTDPYQRAQTESIFGGHKHGGGQIEGFLRVQTLWDETMAANVAGYLQGGKDRRMVVIAGGNHIRYSFGIPRRVFRRLPTSYVLVGSTEIEIPESKKDRLMDVEPPDFPLLPYHYLLHTRYEDLPQAPVRLGVMLDENAEEKVFVEGILPGSAAETAGLLKGDRILAIDGEAVDESFDVVYAVGQKRPGDTLTLLIDRAGERQSLQATFPMPPKP